MIVLAIDTCEVRGSIAVLKDDETLQVVPHTDAEEYSSWLLPAVDLALESAKTTLGEVGLFAVASGPGSFTGVRIGLTTAKAWSEVFSKPVIGVSRLEAVACQSELHTKYVASFIDAQRGQIFGAVYQRGGDDLMLIEQEMAAIPEVFTEWVDRRAPISEVAWISTDPDARDDQPGLQRKAAQGEKVQCVPCILAPRIGKMAFARVLKGDVGDALSVNANYVRRSYVEVFQKGPVHVPRK
jgi:tRNA threonylcarbamoyladenosine biosynthesis protein TsaB